MIEFPHLMQAASVLVSLAALLATIIINRGKAASDRVAALEKAVADKASSGRMGALEDRVDKVEDRTTTVESEIRHLPSRDQNHNMELALRDLRGEMAQLNERMKPVVATSERLQEILLDLARDRRGTA